MCVCVCVCVCVWERDVVCYFLFSVLRSSWTNLFSSSVKLMFTFICCVFVVSDTKLRLKYNLVCRGRERWRLRCRARLHLRHLSRYIKIHRASTLKVKRGISWSIHGHLALTGSNELVWSLKQTQCAAADRLFKAAAAALCNFYHSFTALYCILSFTVTLTGHQHVWLWKDMNKNSSDCNWKNVFINLKI